MLFSVVIRLLPMRLDSSLLMGMNWIRGSVSEVEAIIEFSAAYVLRDVWYLSSLIIEA